MKPSEIQVGKTYANRVAGDLRTVVYIELGSRASALAVLYSKDTPGSERRWISLVTFARWASHEVKYGDDF